jgi:hypothetical protein
MDSCVSDISHFTRHFRCCCVLLGVTEHDERNTQIGLLFDRNLSYFKNSGHVYFKQTYEYKYFDLLFSLHVVLKEIGM